MERTVPKTASEEIELFLRTLYSLLRSTTEIQIRTLEEVHSAMNSLLHSDARQPYPDMSAFLYSIQRLPGSIMHVRLVVLGQSTEVFVKRGYGNIETWAQVTAPARRRRWFFNGQDTLAGYIASRTDIEDLVPTLTAFQIEWNKMHYLLKGAALDSSSYDKAATDPETAQKLAEVLQISTEDLSRLVSIWGESFAENIHEIQSRPCSLRLQLLGGSMTDYWRATRIWWQNIEKRCPELLNRPIYFISSNTHSMTNLLTGFALQKQELLCNIINRSRHVKLQETLARIQSGSTQESLENFLYFTLREFSGRPEGWNLYAEQQQMEDAHGIFRVPSEHSFEVEAQTIEISRLDPEVFDPRLKQNGTKTHNLTFLKDSDAIILNIDYPLGLAAFNILAKVAENVNPILGVYVMGKAATLNGIRGDVMIPNVVHDENSQNTYLFQNAFSAHDVAPYLNYGTVLDNQKAVSVFGTFLQNARIMDVFYREGYTDIEMEAGPYLSAIYEMYRPKRHPVNEIVNLYNVPFDIGILHYASDTPLSKGKNLGAGALSYYGLDSTYAASVAILRRIISQEKVRLAA